MSISKHHILFTTAPFVRWQAYHRHHSLHYIPEHSSTFIEGGGSAKVDEDKEVEELAEEEVVKKDVEEMAVEMEEDNVNEEVEERVDKEEGEVDEEEEMKKESAEEEEDERCRKRRRW